MTLDHAKHIAQGVVHKLMPVTEAIKICGSVRRKQPECSDIDVVVIPKRIGIKDLFGNTTGYGISREFIDVVNQWKKVKGDAFGKYTQRLVDGEKVEISIATPENFGNLVMIRSGPADFSHKMMLAVLKRGLEQRDGYLWKDDKIIPCYTEEDFFSVLNLPYIVPEFRNKDSYK